MGKRLRQYYGKLNSVTVYPLPWIEDILADCSKGRSRHEPILFQTRVNPDHIKYTATLTRAYLLQSMGIPVGGKPLVKPGKTRGVSDRVFISKFKSKCDVASTLTRQWRIYTALPRTGHAATPSMTRAHRFA